MLNRLLASRPVTRLLRYAYRYTHPRAMRHNQAFWPLVAVRRDENARLIECRIRGASYSPALTDLDEVPRHPGQSCHLILSGPSVAQIDYSLLDLGNVMGVNGSIALQARFPELKFNYYAMLDTGFMSRRRHMVEQILSQDLLLFTTPEAVKWIALNVPARRIACRLAVFEEVHQRTMQPRPTPGQLTEQLRGDPDLILFDAYRPVHAHGFSLDVRRGLFGAGTVAYSALQFLVWLGFGRIYIHGLDMKNAASQPRFYETEKDRLGTALDRQFAGHIEPAFRDASVLLRQRGVQVYNLSMDSALGDDVFPKIDWRTLISSRHFQADGVVHSDSPAADAVRP
ncbi:lipopolysaccharide core biosynthesis protein [Bordetella ansorpii]|uniref:Lipopolysaccharide core biosynthesis protein n=1 Tax=Bordetella ansorpii TaxID=288768 RepID=A0A157SRY7_9BORD|nr:hypothetical protein [Bordetella ansorpii]SAI73202.1 lipopolysaccharide core biosynthesis protein [Bordetella ansorpii]